MTEYNELVEYQKVKLEAETWAKGIKALHAHSLSSMWYDDRPQDTANGKSVIDVEHNDGSIVRTLLDTDETVHMGVQLTGEELYDAFYRRSQNT